ncbi:hypothetical protein [Halococcus agarilyticus]|uniref:hypothetical protein n=1 Tax=Halococcus agarilyticus TaxID=1232219 RepID=UPI0006778C60|nr:hypothetical protein [Halococcus agarilyticus]
MRIERRSLLGAVGSVAVVGVTGCISSTGSEPGTESGKSGETAAASGDARTVTRGNSESLSFTAEAIEQPSSEAPARIEAALKNTGPAPVRVGLGPTLLFSDDTGDLAWSSEVVLDPDDPGVKMPGETRLVDGCWRHLADAEQPIQSILGWRTIEPNGSLRETFDAYTRGDSGSCLPEGRHRYQSQVLVGNESHSVTTTLVVRISSDRTLSATARVGQSISERTPGSARATTSSTPAMTPSTPVGTSDAGADLGLTNTDDERHTVRIVVEKGGNAPLFDRETTVSAGESMEWDLPLDEAGTYRITATLDGGASATYEWALDDPSAAAARIVYIDVEDGDVGFTNMYV